MRDEGVVSDLAAEGWVPAPGNRFAALWTAAIRCQTILRDEISVTFHEKLMAIGTASIFKVAHRARKIARVDVTKAGLFSDLGGAHERLRAGVVRIGHLVIFVKCRDVPWNIRRDADQKLRQTGQFIVGVI